MREGEERGKKGFLLIGTIYSFEVTNHGCETEKRNKHTIMAS